MELLIYLSIYILTIWFIFFPKSLPSNYFFIFWLSISMCLSLIIRSSIGETSSSDIDGYISNMMYPEIISLNYYLREFIFWFGIRFLYSIIGDGAMVFVFLDFIFYLCLYKGFSLCRRAYYPQIGQRDVNYLFFAVLLFFPVVMGMHNIYRQLLASTIFLISIGLIGNSKPIKGYLTSLVAVFIHNAVGMFLPVLMVCTKNKLFHYMAFIILIPIIFFTSGVDESSSGLISRDGSIEIGKTIKYMYLISLFLAYTFFIYIEWNSNLKLHSTFIAIFSILIIMYAANLIGFSSEQAQRTFFYISSILFPFLGYYCFIKFKPRILSSLIFFHISLLPLILIFNTTIDLSL